ncbi:MAG: carboxy terminal-processing peptidase [Cyclobacteriaceae bacterium]|nr:carboxy terminal-processing peptidase [Cyclobacteriaceae bacterium]
MKRLLAGGVMVLALGSVTFGQSGKDSLELRPKAIYGKEAHVVISLLDGFHYRKLAFNDSLSSAVLDAFLKELDDNRTYFLASDIQGFEKYRRSIDDLIRKEDVSFAYDIYKQFLVRYKERMDYVLNHLVDSDFDYTVDEYYESDREKMPWATTRQELDDLWRRIIKSQALSLKLANKKPEEIKQTLRKRFERFSKTMKQVNSEDVFGTFMNAATESYDPHTSYFSPRASDVFKQNMSLSLEGIGAQLTTDNDYTKINRVVPGGPADKSEKIHQDDLITGVAQGDEGEMVDVVGWRVDDVVKLIKGPKGTVVRIQLLPAKTGVSGPPEVVRLVRDKIKLEDQAARKQVINIKDGSRDVKMGVITIPAFYMDFEAAEKGDPNYRSTTRDVAQLIKELEKEHVDGLIIDLRNNGGGALPEAINLTGLFIKDGPVVQVRDPRNQVQQGLDDDPGVLYGGPLLVLTNRFSASASEIFAGAIQDYHRGLIVGETTYGKGTVQRVLDLQRAMRTDEKVGQVNYTIQKFYRVTGSSTQHKGVAPDIRLPSAFDATKYGESSTPNPLPWDVIKPASFVPSGPVNDKLIAQLNKDYKEREKYDAGLRKFIVETDELRKNLTQSRISLNEARRRAEMDEAEKRKVQDQNLSTRVGREGLPVDDLSKMDDEYLREGLLILADFIHRRTG